jgi:hypothetical protein
MAVWSGIRCAVVGKSVIDRKETLKRSKSKETRGEGDKAPHGASMGLIICQKEPKVLETPVDRVDSFLTPTELFYVRSHSPVPKLELAFTGCRSMARSGARFH